MSQYTFAMCSYRERKQDPTDILQLDGHTVDFCDPLEGEFSRGDMENAQLENDGPDTATALENSVAADWSVIFQCRVFSASV